MSFSAFEHALEVVERELRVDRDDAVDLDHRVDALAAGEAVLELERGRRQPVAQEVLEQQLAEPAASLRRPQDLLQLAQLLRLLGHLHGGLADLAELLVDRVRLLRRVLEPPVDLRVELAEPPVHRLRDRLEPPVDLGVPMREQPVEHAAEPDGESAAPDHEDEDGYDDRH